MNPPKLLTSLYNAATSAAMSIAYTLTLGKIGTPSVEHEQTIVGGGYWALRSNTSAAGLTYTKLVKADSSKPANPMLQGKPTNPTTGARVDRPYTRRARRNVQRAA